MSTNTFESLVELAARLREPDGCPWDRDQTHESMMAYLIEESYEVLHAIRSDDSASLKDELGDLLFHIAFHAQLAQERASFDAQDIIDAAHDKVIRRHPHVFGKNASSEISNVRRRWEELKHDEKSAESEKSNSLPALIETRKLLAKARNLQLKLDLSQTEECEEEFQKITATARARPEVLVDFLVKVVQISEELGIDPEIALKERNRGIRLDLEAHRNHTS